GFITAPEAKSCVIPSAPDGRRTPAHRHAAPHTPVPISSPNLFPLLVLSQADERPCPEYPAERQDHCRSAIRPPPAAPAVHSKALACQPAFETPVAAQVELHSRSAPVLRYAQYSGPLVKAAQNLHAAPVKKRHSPAICPKTGIPTPPACARVHKLRGYSVVLCASWRPAGRSAYPPNGPDGRPPQ